jgi:hypothetical protein
MDQRVYHLLHLVGLFVMTAYTFRAFAAPGSNRRGNLMISGIASLVVVVAGFGLLAKLKLDFSAWIIIKVVCWLVLSGLAGMAHRKGRAGILPLVALLLITAAVYAVYFRPTF